MFYSREFKLLRYDFSSILTTKKKRNLKRMKCLPPVAVFVFLTASARAWIVSPYLLFNPDGLQLLWLSGWLLSPPALARGG